MFSPEHLKIPRPYIIVPASQALVVCVCVCGVGKEYFSLYNIRPYLAEVHPSRAGIFSVKH